jgi:hypothetical protein
MDHRERHVLKIVVPSFCNDEFPLGIQSPSFYGLVERAVNSSVMRDGEIAGDPVLAEIYHASPEVVRRFIGAAKRVTYRGAAFDRGMG